VGDHERSGLGYRQGRIVVRMGQSEPGTADLPLAAWRQWRLHLPLEAPLNDELRLAVAD
jgi:hypothetical protein